MWHYGQIFHQRRQPTQPVWGDPNTRNIFTSERNRTYSRKCRGNGGTCVERRRLYVVQQSVDVHARRPVGRPFDVSLDRPVDDAVYVALSEPVLGQRVALARWIRNAGKRTKSDGLLAVTDRRRGGPKNWKARSFRQNTRTLLGKSPVGNFVRRHLDSQRRRCWNSTRSIQKQCFGYSPTQMWYRHLKLRVIKNDNGRCPKY